MVEKIKKAKQKLRSPSAFTILFVVIIVMAALTWVVPSGLYKTNEDGDRIANSYYLVDKERTVTEEKDGKKEEVKSRVCGTSSLHLLKVCQTSLMSSSS